MEKKKSNYLGKTKLYKFLKDKKYNVPKMKDMEYEKYRGSEWLKTDEIDLWRNGGKIYVESYRYTDDGERKKVNRKGYNCKDGSEFYNEKKKHW